MAKPLDVLMIEDRESDALLVLRQLKRAGYQPQHRRVQTAEELRKALQWHAWQVVLADFSLPQFSGLDALRLVRQWDEDVPFLIVSGAIGEETAVATMKAGADDYVLKDNLARLGPAIERELRDAESRRARREAEQQLRLREALFRSLIENVADMVVILDDWAVVRYQSPSVERVLGYRREETTGTRCFACLHPDELEYGYDILFSQVRRRRQVSDVQCRVRHRDGSWRTLEGTVTNLLDDPAVHGIVCNFRDTTERKYLEGQLVRAQRMETIGNLAGGIAHDLNNLLTPVLVASDLLGEDLSAEDREALLETLRSGANRAVEIVEQLLSLARGGRAGGVRADVAQVIRDTERLMRYSFPDSIWIESRAGESLWPVLIGPAPLGQVLMNLCVNARDAMPGGGRLRIEADNVTLGRAGGESLPTGGAPGDYVRLSVTDTGAGIPEEMRQRVFEPFVTTKEVGRGTGLGLWIVTRIVGEAGGFLDLDTSAAGTTFSIHLPAATETQPEAARDLPSTSAPAEVSVDGIILVAEGEAALRQIIQETLETYGCETVTAADGAEAVALYRENLGKITLAVLDVDLPVLDGPAAIAAMSQMEPRPRVVLQHRETADRERLEAAGAHVSAWLEKPFTTEQLLSSIREAAHA